MGPRVKEVTKCQETVIFYSLRSIVLRIEVLHNTVAPTQQLVNLLTVYA